MYAVMALRESRENPTIPVARDSWCQRLKSVSVASAMRMLKLLAGIVELVGRECLSNGSGMLCYLWDSRRGDKSRQHCEFDVPSADSHLPRVGLLGVSICLSTDCKAGIAAVAGRESSPL